MPRYVILKHSPPDHSSPVHWDLMLDTGTVLRTWSLAEFPTAGKTLVARQLDDHRREYLDYQGPVSRNRGTVAREESGDYVLVSDMPDRLLARLVGPTSALLLELTRNKVSPRLWTARFSRIMTE